MYTAQLAFCAFFGTAFLLLLAKADDPDPSKLCQVSDDPILSKQRTAQIKSLEDEFHQAKIDGEKKIAEAKKEGSPKLEELQSEYDKLVSNYNAYLYMMKQKPAFCDQLIQDLKDTIEYFISYLKQF